MHPLWRAAALAGEFAWDNLSRVENSELTTINQVPVERCQHPRYTKNSVSTLLQNFVSSHCLPFGFVVAMLSISVVQRASVLRGNRPGCVTASFAQVSGQRCAKLPRAICENHEHACRIFASGMRTCDGLLPCSALQSIHLI